MTEERLKNIRDKLAEDLACLPRHKIVAFGASCSERMVNYYDEFTKKGGWGDFVFIRSALDLIWEFLLGQQDVKERLQATLLKFDAMIPDVDDFGGAETVFAQDACVCIGTTLDLCLEIKRSPSAIVEFSFEALSKGRCLAYTGGEFWNFGDWPEEIEFDKAVLEDPFVKKEINLQREDLALLNSQEELSKDIILTLKNRAHQNQWKASDILNTPGVFEFKVKSDKERLNRTAEE